jgi:HEAT repeat protein
MGRLQTALRIRPGEGAAAFRLLTLMVVGMAGAVVGSAGVESLFFSRYGPEFLPTLYVALGPITFAVMVGMGALLSQEATRFLTRLPLGLAIVLLAARAALLPGARWFYPVLWLVMMVVWTMQVMASWGLAGAISDTRQAKRLFPLYGAGLILGGVIGGLTTGPLAAWLHTENLLLVWSGALVGTWLIARSVVGTAAVVSRRRRHRGPGVLTQMAHGFRDVWGWPLLRWMSLGLILFAVLYFTLSLLFARAATARFPQTDQLAGFLGLFMAASNGAALLVSILLANRLFAAFGVLSMVLMLAVIYLAGYAALIASASFVILISFRFVQMVWVNGVWATGWQALFNVVPSERRARTRVFMDGGPLQAGIVLSGLLLILADRVLEPRHLYLVGALAAVLAVLAMWRAKRAYATALVEALRAGNPDVFRLEEEPFGGIRHDAEANAAVLAGATDPDPTVRRVSMDILADVSGPDAEPVLVRALADVEPEIRAAAVRGLSGSDDPSVAAAIEPLLEDPEPEVRARAAGALDAVPTLSQMCRDPRPEWRSWAVRVLGTFRVDADAVLRALSDEDPRVRREAANALASFEPGDAVQPLVEALGDPEVAVRDASAAALARLGPSAEDPLIAALARAELEHGAVLALASIPGPPRPELRAYARDQVEFATRYHRMWLEVSSDGDERPALLAHAVRHRAVEHALNALRAVGRHGDPATMAAALDNLSSADAQQRANALETLEAVGEAEVVRPLLAVWEAAPARSPDAPSAIAELMEDRDPWVRACATLAAAGSGRPSDLEELAASDPDPLVREAAAMALNGGLVETLSTLSLLQRVLFLKRVPLFADLSPEDLKHVAEVATEHAYPDGEVIAEQGEAGDEMHIVVAGEIRVLVGHDGEPPHEVARRSVGEYVGEMAIIGQEARMASLACAGSVRTLSLDQRSFQRILRERPDVSLAVMRVLSDRLRESYSPTSA